MAIIKEAPKSVIATFLEGEAVSAFWSFGSKAIALLNTFFTIGSLTLYQYGIFQLLLSVVGISFDSANLGGGVVSNEISRAVAEHRESDAKKIFNEYAVVRIFIAIASWAVLFFGASFFFSVYSAEFIKGVRIIAFLPLSEILYLIVRTLCIVRCEFSLIGIRGILNKTIQAGILIFFFFKDDLGLKQLIYSVIISSSASLVIVLVPFFKIYKRWKDVTSTGHSLLKDVFLKYGMWDTLRQLGNKLTFRIKPWLIKLFVNTEAVAVFSIAEMLVSGLQDILPSKTLQSLVPRWIKEKKLSIKAFSYGIKYFFISGLVLAILAAIFVPTLMHLIFPKYAASVPLFLFMIWNLPVFAVGIILGNYIIAHRRQKFLFFQHMARNVLALIIIFSTLPFLGLWGLAIESVVIPILMVSFAYWYTKKRNPGFYFDKKIILNFGQEDRMLVKKICLILKDWLKGFKPVKASDSRQI